jgi:hypothetical protein
MPEAPSGVPAQTMRGAIAAFADALSAAGPDDPVLWRGPHAGLMHTPLVLTRNAFMAWREHAKFASDFSKIVNTACGGSEKPLLILAGGTGAIWPFVADAAGLSPFWLGKKATAKIAEGAARYSPLAFSLQTPIRVPEPPTLLPPAAPVSLPDRPSAETPPWLRRRNLLDDTDL